VISGFHASMSYNVERTDNKNRITPQPKEQFGGGLTVYQGEGVKGKTRFRLRTRRGESQFGSRGY